MPAHDPSGPSPCWPWSGFSFRELFSAIGRLPLGDRRTCWALLLVAHGVPATAAERWEGLADRIFYNYSVDQGLPSGRVSQVAHDAEGFAWLVTQESLFRWDGHVFERVETGVPDVDSDVRIMRAEPEGNALWLGTGSGLKRFDPVTRGLRDYPLSVDETFAVMDLDFGDGSDRASLWLGAERGVFRVDTRSGAVTRYLTALFEADRTLRVFAIEVTEDGTVWAGTTVGLYRMPPGSSDFERFDPAVVAGATRVASLVEAASGDLWVGTARSGAYRIAPSEAVSAIDIPEFDGEWIFSMAEVAPNVIWFGTYGQGLIEFDEPRGRVRRMQHDPLLGHSLAQDEVWTIVPDAAGRVWVGQGRGLSLHDRTQDALLTVFGGSGRALGLRDSQVKSLLERRDGSIAVGLIESGVDLIDPVSGRIGTLDVDSDRPGVALPGGAIEALAEGPDGALYVGSNWGLYRLADSTLVRLRPGERSETLFAGSLQFHLGHLWVGGTDGLWRLDPSSTPIRSDRIAASVGEDFTDPRISTLAPAPDDDLVVGTWAGVNWIDGSGAVTDRIPGKGDASPFANGYITAIVHDRGGRIWLGTSGGGIYLRDEAGASLRRLARADGLPSDVIGGLLDDGLGRIWASSNGGLAVINVDSLSVTALGPAQGAMVAPYFRQPAAVTREGELLFGGDRGLTIVRPDRWQPAMEAAPVAIVGVRVAGEAVADRRLGRSAEAPLIVPAEGNAFSVEFAALDFLDPGAANYRHRLDGYERAWQTSGPGQRVVSYTSLPPGRYRLLVEASRRDGAWSGQPATRHLRVLPHWYQTPWAQALFFVLALALIATLFRARTRQLRSRQVELEALIRERTRELEASTDALREKSEALEQASMTDPLTGLHNRRFLESTLPAEEAFALRRYGEGRRQPVADGDLLFFLLDMDHFKAVNDQHGHLAGDDVLRAMRARLEHVVREADFPVRWGGEEFLLVVRGTSRARGPELAERMLEEIRREPFDLGNGVQHSMTCSVGYSAFPFDIEDPTALGWLECVQLADRALYTAKRAGRNAWVGVSRGQGGSARTLIANDDPAALLESGALILSGSVTQERILRAWSGG